MRRSTFDGHLVLIMGRVPLLWACSNAARAAGQGRAARLGRGCTTWQLRPLRTYRASHAHVPSILYASREQLRGSLLSVSVDIARLRLDDAPAHIHLDVAARTRGSCEVPQ